MRKKYTITLGLLTMLVALPQLGLAQLTDGPVTNDECVRLSTPMMRYRSTDAATGGEVSMLQDFLITKGFLTGAPTGFFGAMTVRAVKDYQGKKGVEMTGNVGALTKSKIAGDTCTGTSVSATTPVSLGNATVPVISGGPVATPASVSPVDVSVLQRQIAELTEQLRRMRNGGGDDTNLGLMRPLIDTVSGGDWGAPGKYRITIGGQRFGKVGTVKLKYAGIEKNIPFVDFESITDSKVVFIIDRPAAQYENVTATVQIFTRDDRVSNIMTFANAFYNPNHVTAAAAVITVDMPYGRSVVGAGSNMAIHWTWNEATGPVAMREGFALALIEVDQSGSDVKVTPIANDVEKGTVKNGARFDWVVPTTIQAGDGHHFQVQVATEDCCKPTAISRSEGFNIIVATTPTVAGFINATNVLGKELPSDLNLSTADVSGTDVNRVNNHMLKQIDFAKGKYRTLRAQVACRRLMTFDSNSGSSVLAQTHWLNFDLKLNNSRLNSFTCSGNQENTYPKVDISDMSGAITAEVTDSETWNGASAINKYPPFGVIQFTGVRTDGVEESIKAFAFGFSIKG